MTPSEQSEFIQTALRVVDDVYLRIARPDRATIDSYRSDLKVALARALDTLAPPAAVQEAETVDWPGCRCEACLELLPPDDNPIPHHRRIMVVCEFCGNKRCPHSWDHRYVCTGSNEPNQTPTVTEPANGQSEWLPPFTSSGPMVKDANNKFMCDAAPAGFHRVADKRAQFIAECLNRCTVTPAPAPAEQTAEKPAEDELAAIVCERCKGNGRIEMLEHCPLCKGFGSVVAFIERAAPSAARTPSAAGDGGEG